MSILVRIFCLMVVVIIFSTPNAYAASVPVTVEEDYQGLPEPMNTVFAPLRLILDPIVDAERKTCDPEFWEVMKDRAWQEGQREITQNNNLIARPDSVLQMTCFDMFVNHLTRHSGSNFPGDPQEGIGQMTGGIIGAALAGLAGKLTDWIVLDVDEFLYANGNNMNNLPSSLGGPVQIIGTDGFLTFAVLEMLVLDQLVDDVPSESPSNIMRGYDLAEKPTLVACAVAHGAEYKKYYADDNFPTMFLGGRSGVSTELRDEATEMNYNCSRMLSVWNQSRCYNILAESNIFGFTPDHDGFYPLQTYRDEAAAGRDFRTRETMCDPPPNNFDLVDYMPDLTPINSDEALGYLCDLASHGLPNISGCSTSDFAGCASAVQLLLTAAFGSGSLPDWNSAYSGSNPVSGSAGGVDSYLHFLELRDSTDCSSITPIQTGYIVIDASGNSYVDAVCPAPGCYFNPPNGSTSGSCN